MKILHVITSLQAGGAEKLMVDLLPRLRDKGHEVELAIFDGRVTSFYEKLNEQGIKVHRFMPNGGNVYNPINLWKLIRLIRKGRYDIVHTHNTAPQLFAAIGSVVCSTAFYTTEHSTSNRRRGLKCYVPIDRWVHKRYKRVICISDKTKENLIKYIGDKYCKKIITIHNGIDVARFATARPSSDVEGGTERFNIIQVAGFRNSKDQPTVIRALSKLPKKFHLYLVGAGVLRSNCEALVEEFNLTDRVHFMGIRADVPELISASDICVVSSHWEGFGLAAAEAMAATKPVIATDVPGLREVVKDAGILFPHGDSEALAHEFLSLANDTEYYHAVADACRRRADNFDISTMAENYNKIYLSQP